MGERPRILNYLTPRRDQPRVSAGARYERDGWIGLAVTLAACLVAAVWWLNRR